MSTYAETLAALAPLTPPEADALLDQALAEQASASQAVELAAQRLERATKQYAADAPEYVAERQREHDRAVVASSKAWDVVLAHHDNFTSRGGWPRAWIVPNGHVHAGTLCSTCFSTTRFGLVPQFSGMAEAQIVDAAGARACTVCFPNAPVGNTPHPAMLHREEREAQTARADREQKAAAAAAKAMQGEDGGPLYIAHVADGERSNTVVKTETKAKTALSDELYYALFESNKAMRPDATQPALEHHGENADALVHALARKHGTSVEAEVTAAINRLVKKDKALAANLQRAGTLPGSTLDWGAR